MLVLVTVHALSKRNFVKGVLPFGNMALRAGYSGMLRFKGIGAGCVFLDVELGRLESIDAVTA